MQHLEGAGCRSIQRRVRRLRQAGLEHRGVIGRLVAREGKVGPAGVLQRFQRRRAAASPSLFEIGGEALEAQARDIGHQLLAVAEMPVGRGRADPRRARRLRDREAGGAFFTDQAERALDQRLA